VTAGPYVTAFTSVPGRDQSKRHPDDVTHLWDELAGQDTFPVGDLVEILTLQQACDLPL
jgi:hypothetical protein